MTMALPKVRVLHLADIHIGMENYGSLDARVGLSSRVVDFVRRLDEAVDYALGNEVDLVLFCGDAYKTRNPNATIQREFARRIKRLSDADIPVLLLVGNHDQPNASRRASSIDIFGTLGVRNVVVANTEKIHVIATRQGVPVQVLTLPYRTRSHFLTHDTTKNMTIEQVERAAREAISQNIAALAEQLNPELPTIVAGHLTVAEAKQGSEQHVMIGQDVVVLKSVLADPRFDYVALGHIHRHQDLNEGQHPPLVYAGSLERIDFGEEREAKGFVVADIQKGTTSYRFVPVQARRFVTIQVDADVADPMALILHEIQRREVQDAVVRVLISASEETEPLIDERPIRQALADAHYVSAIRKDVRRHHRHRLGDQSPEELTPLEALRRYFMAKKLPEDRIEALLERAQPILQNPAE